MRSLKKVSGIEQPRDGTFTNKMPWADDPHQFASLIAEINGDIFHEDPREALSCFLLALAKHVGVREAYVGRWISGAEQDVKIEVISYLQSGTISDFSIVLGLNDQPCESLYTSGEPVLIKEGLAEAFPDCQVIKDLGATHFFGLPFLDLMPESNSKVNGNISVLGDRSLDLELILKVSQHYKSWIITQIRRFEKDRNSQLAQDEYRDLFESTFDVVMHFDKDHKLIKANSAIERFLDISNSDQHPYETVLEEDRHIIIQNRQDLAEKGCTKDVRFRVRDPQGEIIHVAANTVVRYDEAKELIGYREVIRDVTAEEKAAQEIFDSREELRTIFDRSSVGLALAKDYELTQVNPYLADMLGYKSDELIGKNPLLMHLPEEHEKLKQQGELLIEGTKNELHWQSHLVHKEGHLIPAEITLHRLVRGDGSIRRILATIVDLTQRRRSEAALEAAEAKNRSLIDTSPAGIIQLDENFQVEFLSKRILEIHGIKLSQKINDFFELVIEKDRRRIKSELADLISDEARPLTFQSGMSQDGKVQHVQGAARALFDSKGHRTGLLVCYADVSAQVIAKRRLEISQARYRSIVESSPSGISILNDQGMFLYASPRAREIFGVPHDLPKGDHRSVWGYVAPDHRENLEVFFSSAIRSGEVEKERFKALSEDGRPFWIEAYAKSRKSADGHDEITVVKNDITELLQVEKELETEKAIYQSLISNSFDGIDILEFERSDINLKDGKILIRNRVMHELLGSDDEVTTTSEAIANIMPADIYKSSQQKEEELNMLLQKQVVTGSWLIRHDDETLIYTEGVLRLLEQDDSIFVVRILNDVTEQRKAEQTIQNQLLDLNGKNEELERYIVSNLQLENFAYIASHDLKAPARSIGSFAHLLQKTANEKLSERENHFLDIILESSKNMMDLIDDLLVYSRVNQEKISLRTVDFERLLESVLQDLQPEMDECRAQIRWQNLPEDLEGDTIKLRQLFLNLLNNSLKFRKEDESPRILIDCDRSSKYWIFEISDNGIGIEEKYADKVFLLFQKLHSSDKYDGSGMGLAISKKIIEQHFGKIEVIPQGASGGATIRFTIARDLSKRITREQSLLVKRRPGQLEVDR